ncbi:hypothetical protein [Zunongwangia endophytica]|uniref:Uncharacterized protein n=1 Tax=Zunongwangia endophytica TaxID=1808945 RepID=A0ABV8HAX8_9FLAO|nr:hypothetical protein [Zunongwangia endophytica]MDN3594341.1 hypothetical protein [Zunongwangia endophytica]
MDYFFWGLIAIGAFYSIKESKTKKLKKIFIGLYASIFIIGFAYLSGEQIGQAIYHLSHSN